MILHVVVMDAMGITLMVLSSVAQFRQLPLHNFFAGGTVPSDVGGNVVVVVPTAPEDGARAVAAAADCA